ncbi:MAG TPA: hypothetical protein VM241_04415 [Candidatus Thermoplasmatota archaeon]|nr:hypothetical protein [Candidatus Thermoplasmatota archaeon]
MRSLLLPVAALLTLTALAGCAKAPANGTPATGTEAGTTMAGQAHGLLNYTTPDPGGPRYTRDYAGTLTAQEASGLNGGLPLGLSPPTFNTCCYLDWVDTPDLLAPDQLVSLRITVNWTNTDTDHAGLDAAACVPWNCQAFTRGPDESAIPGPHSDSLTLITGGRQDFLDQGLLYQAGVRYTNAVLSNGLAYAIHVEATPVGNGLAPGDPYMVHVAPNATVSAEFVGPVGGTVSAGLMVYGANDRPLRWLEVSGPPGSRVNLTLPAGTPVVVAYGASGGFVRLATDRAPQMLAAHPLKTESGQLPVAAVADAQEHSGDFSYAAPPGSMGDFPFFLYGDGAAAQNALGFEPQRLGGANITLASSRGTVASLDRSLLGANTAVAGSTCLNCNTRGRWLPQNYLDDDGTYQVHWSSGGAVGQFILFTQRFVR